jgi:hypothetical protein
MADRLDPQNSHVDRLYQFWQAYEKEAKLLRNWHDDAFNILAEAQGSPNALYKSFLDTWGGGDFENDAVPLDRKSYFAALAVVSRWLRDECLSVLKDVLDAEKDGSFKVDLQTGKPRLRAGVSPEDADDKAKKKIYNDLLKYFDREDASLKTIDSDVKGEVSKLDPPDRYLEALLRMMRIETNCFRIQIGFLKDGQVPSAPAAS